MRARRALTALAATTIATLAPVAAVSVPAAAVGPVTRTYAYGTASPAQKLDARYTPGPTGRPWVMVVHGGSWSYGDKSGMLTAVAAFQAAGFVVFNTNYRLSTEAPWPAQRVDVANALLWVKAHWRAFGINPGRGGLYGFSAGGHIVSTLGTYGAGRNRTRAVITVSGVNDPKRGWGYAHDPAAAKAAGFTAAQAQAFRYVADRTEYLVRCSPVKASAACAARWADINPGADATPDDAPFLIFHGAADDAVPYTESQALSYYLWKAHARTTYVKVPRGPHGQVIVWGDAARARQAVAFMRANTR